MGAVDAGIDALATAIEAAAGPVELLPGALVDALLPDGPDDDVAVLVARVPPPGADASSATLPIAAEPRAVADARGFVAAALRSRGTDEAVVQRAVLLTSELVTNAVLHGRPPIRLRLRHTARHAIIEVYDGTAVLPRRLRPTPDDEHGRGSSSSRRSRSGGARARSRTASPCGACSSSDRAQPGTRTAAPSSRPPRRSSSATFARSSG